MKIPLEDDRQDILRKAMDNAGLSQPPGAVTPEFLRRVRLNPRAYMELEEAIEPPELPSCLQCLSLPFLQWSVNVWKLETPKGTIIIDTGCSPQDLLQAMQGAIPAAILITHLHHDHTGGIGAFPQAALFAPPGLPGAKPLIPAETLEIGGLTWRIIDLRGHTENGVGLAVERGKSTLFFPGDSIFARSIGKCAGAAQEAKRNILAALRALPPHTLICPGHGPATTAADELRYNPFLAEED